VLYLGLSYLYTGIQPRERKNVRVDLERVIFPLASSRVLVILSNQGSGRYQTIQFHFSPRKLLSSRIPTWQDHEKQTEHWQLEGQNIPEKRQLQVLLT